MKNLTKTIKIFFMFLLFSLVSVSISNGQGKGADKGYWMDVVISPVNWECTEAGLPNAVLAVDTTFGCKGAYIPDRFKSFYINTLEHCFDLPEPLFSGSGIIIQSVEMHCERDRKTGRILGFMFWLKDIEQNYYHTKMFALPVPVAPNPSYFAIPVDDCLKIFPQTKKGKKKALGTLSVGLIEFMQK